MRDIEFRGIDVETGEWVFGDLEHFFDLTRIEGYIVDPETVGQYTGLKDKNGVKIFEGDIVKASYAITHLGNGIGEQEYTEMYKNVVCEIIYDNAQFLYNNHNSIYRKCLMFTHCDCEVIGNIHDNPELLSV